MFVSLGEVRGALERVASGFDAAVLTAEQAEAAVDHAVAIKHMAATVEALAAARVAATGRWRQAGDRSAAEWLARRSGTSRSQCEDVVRTGRRLDGLDGTAAAARRGELSPAQATEIADAAAVAPAAEADLVGLARRGASLGELRDEARRRRAAADPDPEATHRRIHRNRSLRRYTDSEGGYNLHLRHTVEAGARIDAALQPLIDQAFRQARAEGREETVDAYAADAMVELAGQSLRATTGPGGSGDPGADPGATATPKAKPPAYLGLLRVDVEALRRGHAVDGELVEIAGVGPIPVATAIELLGESVLKLVITRGVDVVNVTHLGRGPTVAQKVAMLWASPACLRLGCNRTRRIQADHRVPWTQVQETRLDNLDGLCKPDHDLKTLHGWALVAGTGRRPMVPPDHPDHPANGPPGTSAEANASAPPPAGTANAAPPAAPTLDLDLEPGRSHAA